MTNKVIFGEKYTACNLRYTELSWQTLHFMELLEWSKTGKPTMTEKKMNLLK